MNKELKEMKKGFDTLLKDANTVIFMTDNGAYYSGTEDSITFTMGRNIDKLYKSDKLVHKDEFRKIILASVATDEELDKMLKDELNKLKEQLEKIKKGSENE